MKIPFATIEDVESRFRALDDHEKTRAAQLLADASVMLAHALTRAGVSWQEARNEPGDILGTAINMVAASMAVRAMKSPVDMPALTQYSQGAVGYTESMTYANPNGDLYMTAKERELLGIGRARCGSIRVAIRREGGADAWD